MKYKHIRARLPELAPAIDQLQAAAVVPLECVRALSRLEAVLTGGEASRTLEIRIRAELAAHELPQPADWLPGPAA